MRGEFIFFNVLSLKCVAKFVLANDENGTHLLELLSILFLTIKLVCYVSVYFV
jgi:hypothetical protein